MIQEGLTRGTGGNLSICDSEHKKMAITPSGIDYFSLKPEDIVILDIPTGKSSKEVKFLPVNRICTEFFINTEKIFLLWYILTPNTPLLFPVWNKTDFLPLIICLPLPVLTFLVPNMRLMEQLLLQEMPTKPWKEKAVLLSNHGAIAGGNDLAEAYHIAETVEFCSEIYCISKSCGSVKILPEEEMKHMMIRFQNYGKRIEEHDEI